MNKKGLSIYFQARTPWLTVERKQLSVNENATVLQVAITQGLKLEKKSLIFVVVNGKKVNWDEVLQEGDSLCLLPIIIGG